VTPVASDDGDDGSVVSGKYGWHRERMDEGTRIPRLTEDQLGPRHCGFDGISADHGWGWRTKSESPPRRCGRFSVARTTKNHRQLVRFRFETLQRSVRLVGVRKVACSLLSFDGPR
jgi:hypothetical protein